MSDPGRVLIAGDWHGNTRWAEEVIFQSRKLLPGEPMRIIVQLGDFGVWSGDEGDHFLMRVHNELEFVDAWLMVVLGNHEDYDRVETWTEAGYPKFAAFSPEVNGYRLNRISILPRGHRWTWHHRTWLACGGAASPDRAWRERNYAATGVKQWWEQEYITGQNVLDCTRFGAVDVLVSHDRPAKARLSLPPWPPGWDIADLGRANASRGQVQRICAFAHPKHVMHGHYHLPFSCEQHDLGYGPVTVSQLGRDGENDNLRVLDVRDMTWTPL